MNSPVWGNGFAPVQRLSKLLCERALFSLEAAQGWENKRIAAQRGVNRHSVALWRQRVGNHGVIGCIWEAGYRSGPQGGSRPEKTAPAIITATLHRKPAGSTHWSTRTLAAQTDVSKSTVQRVWEEHQLKPHLRKSFKLSRDPKFLEKLTDVVGVYLTPPQNAVVLCVDEKSQIQALDRTQPGLPLKPGRCGTFTHDYKRNGK